MKKIINWKSMTMLLTVLSVVAPIWIWRADIDSRSLQFRVISQAPLQPSSTSSISGLQISFDGTPLESPYISIIEVSNNGDKPIPSGDFESPLIIHLNKDSTVIRAQVASTAPTDLEASLNWESHLIKVEPLLLNPGDALTISALTSGNKPDFSARARIAGVKSISVVMKSDDTTPIKTGGILLLSALFLFITSDITKSAFSSQESISLRKRAAIFVSIATSVIGAIIFIAFLNTFGVTNIWYIAGCFFLILSVSTAIAVLLNWKDEDIERMPQ